MADPFITTNADEVSEWVDDWKDELKDDAQSLPQRAANATHDRATDEVPVDTGDLRDSLTHAGDEVYSTLDYAPHVGLGTIYMEGTDYLWGPAKEELIRLLKHMAED